MSEFRVALTFDAEHPSRRQCPPGVAEQILDQLARHAVKATFFVQGRWATAYPDLARRIADAGYLVGNHSHSHAPMPDLTDAGLATDIEAAEVSIRRITGADPRPWFRCPFGAGFDDARILDALRRCGYRNVHWDVDAADWEEERKAGDVAAEIVHRSLRRGDGAIVLLHTWPAPTGAALTEIIERLRAANARFVTMAELVDGR
jgi:peptidoglycan-N-acetylglucosamine deacetylase